MSLLGMFPCLQSEGGGESVLVEVVDGIDDGADDSNRVVLGRLAFCEDAIKEISACGKLKAEVSR